ncbi:YqaE/Pmp3 family membrane protein [Paraflavitalea sp. CAU 1676]|uniref:YqaE/Pmp3 family membrane protein n=1 Tax=Paraflavitalea sp. CAU 1676 TaxID=3032598 RepID=UPI0023D9A35E|nr:YqaE/Pmp3 family membrane protein [Paraflavitalea sp. CAU 1676]MDF2191946.1 YqaE/Pmp3 family membrane protein [Paraflavitalea sp. CAU 1676]
MKRLTLHLLLCMILISAVVPGSMAATVVPVPAAATAPASSEPDPNAVNAAMKEFKSLSRSERRARLKDAKKVFKQYKADKRAGKDAETDQVLLAILAILLPPLAVYLKEGEINSKFWISLILTLIFWIPGVIYALLVVFDAI